VALCDPNRGWQSNRSRYGTLLRMRNSRQKHFGQTWAARPLYFSARDLARRCLLMALGQHVRAAANVCLRGQSGREAYCHGMLVQPDISYPASSFS
jgi:hypothetical protein